ncbi:YeeE/YedE family protein [Bermanella marisrubri]|uniref:YeeE/YedE family protein n=1 Tax=Bermanella marisrubri TaxID=207949 RepID=Q1N608_9GAMM|nr:DUF6691 family protein [Bermanella marisrubri]EAT13784.1 hypothetical protein RED65_10339 [Oceanobacter sp. RED65] [Bermanella marisrubri]QIZ84554.1 YeeE/YedE family protein [Bermanella marisrubri]
MYLIISAICGLLFGIGLAASDMNNPERVQSFLDIAGNWDPSLMFVMVGALLIAIPSFQWVLHKRNRPVLDKDFHLANKQKIDGKLIGGAIIFGIGWALVGYCPGPAIAALSYGYTDVIIFVVAMMIGAKAHQLMDKPQKNRA